MVFSEYLGWGCVLDIGIGLRPIRCFQLAEMDAQIQSSTWDQ